MNRKYKISVAMATYNGENYIKEQIETICLQLNKNDELVISDDGSTDDTISIINSLSKKYKQIKLIDGPKNGVKQNFANAISNCEGKYIFLADQDDIWVDGKVTSVLEMFESDNCDCVTHDCDVINDEDNEVIINSFFEHRKSKSGVIYNIYKNRYLGCCMAFKKEMKKYILPIPNNIEMHDQWIGIMCDKHGNSAFLDKKLIHYRRHNKNVSSMSHYPIGKMIKNRLILVKNVVVR